MFCKRQTTNQVPLGQLPEKMSKGGIGRKYVKVSIMQAQKEKKETRRICGFFDVLPSTRTQFGFQLLSAFFPSLPSTFVSNAV